MTDTTCRAALAELVAVKDIKERAAALHFAGPSGPLGAGWEAEWKRLEREYIERQPKAWAAARAALALEAVPTDAEFTRDTDGELLIDWSPAKGRMVTLSLRDDGRLSYAITWDGEKAHGQEQMPPRAPREKTE